MYSTHLLKLVVVVCLFFTSQLVAQSPEVYSRVRVYTPANTISELAALGVCVDHGHYRKGAYLESDFSAAEIAKMQQAGFQMEVLVEDVAAFYEKRGQEPAGIDAISNKAAGCGTSSNSNFPTPLGFSLGSMAGFFTYQEMLNHLDSMASQFPDLITARQPIDTFLSHLGNPIYSLTITSPANPGVSKPQVLYTALHHAREPASLSQLIYYMYFLLENYGTDTEVTYLLDNAELVFVPCINPDGYLRNQQTNANGGGMWRKNRRNNGGGIFGVDLNRNYGYNWGYDDNGSSPSNNSDTYRGPGGFSEPETQAIRFLCLNNDFKVALNHHTFGNLLVYPWGYEAALFTPDSAIFTDLAKWMTKENGFVYGTGDQTVGYTTNGDSDDWMYGEQVLKGKTLSLTPESGDDNDGFWPAQNRIIPVCASNVFQNITAARFVLNYGVATDLSPSLLTASSGVINVALTRMSLDATAPLTVSLEPLSSNIVAFSAAQLVTSLASFDSDTLNFTYTLAANTQLGDAVQFRLLVNNGVVTTADTINKILGPAVQTFADSAITASLWTGSGWNTTPNSFISAPFSFTDSPNGDYQPSTNSNYTLDTLIDLSDVTFAQLKFYAQWEVELGYDYAQVQARVPGGAWQALCGKYTKPGSGNQDQGQPLYDGNSNGWVKEEIDLGTFVGDTIQVRFRLISDNFVEGDGFYFDDLEVLALTATVVDTTDSLTAVAPIQLQPSLAMYPNPAQDKVAFTFAAANANDQIVVLNMLGETALEAKLVEGAYTTSISVADLPAGIYLVHYYTSDGRGSAARKLVISR